MSNSIFVLFFTSNCSTLLPLLAISNKFWVSNFWNTIPTFLNYTFNFCYWKGGGSPRPSRCWPWWTLPTTWAFLPWSTTPSSTTSHLTTWTSCRSTITGRIQVRISVSHSWFLRNRWFVNVDLLICVTWASLIKLYAVGTNIFTFYPWGFNTNSYFKCPDD